MSAGFVISSASAPQLRMRPRKTAARFLRCVWDPDRPPRPIDGSISTPLKKRRSLGYEAKTAGPATLSAVIPSAAKVENAGAGSQGLAPLRPWGYQWRAQAKIEAARIQQNVPCYCKCSRIELTRLALNRPRKQNPGWGGASRGQEEENVVLLIRTRYRSGSGH